MASFFPSGSPHLALVGGHLCEQSLGHLGSLHLLLNFIIDPRRNVNQRLQLEREVRGRARWLWLGERGSTYDVIHSEYKSKSL